MGFRKKRYKTVFGFALKACIIFIFVLLANGHIVEAEEPTVLFDEVGSNQYVLIDPQKAYMAQDSRNTLKAEPKPGGAVKFNLSSKKLPYDLCINFDHSLAKEFMAIYVQEIKTSISSYPFFIFTFFANDTTPKLSKLYGTDM